jgi:hypothetical protein
MTVKDLINNYTGDDIDVCDDYDERCNIAFCTGYKLTEEGEKRFSKALDLEVELVDEYGGYVVGIIHCENGKEATAAKELFYGLSGYISDEAFDKYFYSIEQ